MNYGNEKIRLAAAFTAVTVMTGAMVAAAEYTGEREIIFPEIAALAIGSLLAPKQVWRTSKLRMLANIALFSILGLCVSLFSPLTKVLNMWVVFTLCVIYLPFSGTSFAPLISAAVLPVLLGTDTWIYPLSAVIFTAAIVLAQYVCERIGSRTREEFTPLPPPRTEEFIAVVKRSIFALAILSFAFAANIPFVCAPPLLVAFTELSRPQCAARKRVADAVLSIGICAAFGAFSRILFTVTIGLPSFVSAVAAIAAAQLLLIGIKFYFPPAGALALLAFLIPESDLYLYAPSVLLGAAVSAIAAVVFFRGKERLPLIGKPRRNFFNFS